MTVKHIYLALLVFSMGHCYSQPTTPQAPKSYGQANVSTILRLDEHVRIYCNLLDFPPVIGQNIPVCIKGLKTSDKPKDNLKILMFLNKLLLSKDSNSKQILLKNIQRGDQFCLIADIEVDGLDLCELLIKEKLANKVIEVPRIQKSDSDSSKTAEGNNYIATKSSKIYHRSTCSHAKRIDKAKAVNFPSSQSAEKTGRRPCKTCKP